MSYLNRKAFAVAAVLFFSILLQSSANATYYSAKKHWSHSYKVKNYHYSYQYRHSNKYSKRQWSSSSKYYCSGRRHSGYSHYWHKKKHYCRKNPRSKYCKPDNKKPIAKNDEYHLKASEVIDQNVVDENDTKGDGVNTAYLKYGSLPSGIELASDGSLTGSTSELGTHSVYYKLKDEDGDYSKAKITIHVTKDVAFCPSAAESDELHNGNSSHALWIPHISKNLTFLENPTAIRTLPSGGLVITGTVVDGQHEFSVTMNFTGFESSSSDPKLELKHEAYVANGGPIDPSSWGFFEHLSGTLVGTKGEWEGTTLSFSRRGPMAQIGDGASGKNKNFGFSSWFDAQIHDTTTQLPDGFHIGQKLHGDINVDLPDECKRKVIASQCSVAAEADSYANYPGGHAIILFNLGEERFVFDPAANVEVYNTGDIEISGVAIDSNGQGFNADLSYTMLTEVGTPKLELIDSAYADMAGPVDPTTWKYFDGFSGTLKGISGDYQDVEISLAARGSAAQIGNGANGKNITLGLSNWLTASIVSGNTTTGLHAGDTYYGDINIDIKDDCDTVIDNPVDAVDDIYELEIDEELNVSILDNDTLGDPDTTLTFNIADIPDGFSLSPDGQLTGSSDVPGAIFTFEYTITDADGDTDTATVTITTPNLLVDAVNDTYELAIDEALDVNILDNDTLGDPDTTLTFNPADIPPGFSLSSDGQLTGSSNVPGAMFTFDYTITDANGDTDTATVTITTPNLLVDAVDDEYQLDFGEFLNVNILDNDSLGDPDTVLTFNPFGIPPAFSLSTTGQLTGFSLLQQDADLTFDYTLTDANGDTDTATVIIRIRGIEG